MTVCSYLCSSTIKVCSYLCSSTITACSYLCSSTITVCISASVSAIVVFCCLALPRSGFFGGFAALRLKATSAA